MDPPKKMTKFHLPELVHTSFSPKTAGFFVQMFWGCDFFDWFGLNRNKWPKATIYILLKQENNTSKYFLNNVWSSDLVILREYRIYKHVTLHFLHPENQTCFGFFIFIFFGTCVSHQSFGGKTYGGSMTFMFFCLGGLRFPPVGRLYKNITNHSNPRSLIFQGLQFTTHFF